MISLQIHFLLKLQRINENTKTIGVMNMKKIYSKIVRERKEEFQIETSVQIDSEAKYIVKRSLTPKSEAHVQRMEETYQSANDKTLLCPCFIKEDAVYFQFIEGSTLGQKLLDALLRRDDTATRQIIDKYNAIVDILCENKNKEIISGNEEFQKVFGHYEEEDEEGYRNLIFDLTFDNIIFEEGTPKIIDYEWRFSFPVSKNFIKYRAVYAFEMKYKDSFLPMYTSEEFFALFGLEKELENKYLFYNRSFISFVYGKDGYNDILKRYRKINLSISEEQLLAEEKILSVLLDNIELHKDLFDDYTKFFKVSQKILNEKNRSYLFSDEFLFEFEQFIKGNFDMIEYYKNKSDRKKILNILRKK